MRPATYSNDCLIIVNSHKHMDTYIFSLRHSLGDESSVLCGRTEGVQELVTGRQCCHGNRHPDKNTHVHTHNLKGAVFLQQLHDP